MSEKSASMPARTSPPVRISYPQVFTPRAFKGSDPKYSVTLMFDKKNKEHVEFVKMIKADAEKALAEKWPDASTRPRIPVVGETRSLIKDGDKTCDTQGIPLKEKNPEYEGHWTMRAASANKPVVVDRNRQEIINAGDIYGGCFCQVNVNVYTFNGETNKGVTAGLNGLLKYSDGESFGGGRPSVDDMFGEAPPADGADPFASDEIPF